MFSVGQEVRCVTAGSDHLFGLVVEVLNGAVKVEVSFARAIWFYPHELRAVEAR